jgi:hypothetical protein
MTQQELFRYGYGEYKKAIRHIEAMDQFLSQTKVNYTAEDAKRDFDIVIQGMMLKVAIADNNASDVEIDYIKSIVDTGDILRFVKEGTHGKLDVSWRMLTLLDKETYNKLLGVLEDPLKGVMKKFALPYALMEVILKKNLFDTFKEAIFGIMAPLCMVDGDSDGMNEKLSVALTMKMFESSWDEVKSMAYQEQKKTTPSASPMGNTLKSRFEHLKKN